MNHFTSRIQMLLAVSLSVPMFIRSANAQDLASPNVFGNVQVSQVTPQAPTQKPLVESLFDEKVSIVDPRALVLGEKAYGPMHFGQPINGLAFQDNLVSFRGWQYFALGLE